jgi:hypothetical protein
MQAAAALRAAVSSRLRAVTSRSQDDAGLIDRIAAREIDPWSAAETLLDGGSLGRPAPEEEL